MCLSVVLSVSLPVSPPSLSHSHFYSPFSFWHRHIMASSLSTRGTVFFWTHVVTLTYGKFQHFLLNIVWPFLVLCNRKKKGKDGCKHSWLLKGEIYSWVIKVYDWILSVIGCGEPRGARSMNMNFMLLSILWSFPCISSRLSWGVETSFIFFSLM